MNNVARHKMVLLVCGTRGRCTERDVSNALLNSGWFLGGAEFELTEIVQGEAPGVDASAKQVAGARAVDCVGFYANWAKHGKAAGPERNQRMIDYLKFKKSQGFEVRCIAMPGPNSKGTWDTVRRCASEGIPVYVYEGLK